MKQSFIYLILTSALVVCTANAYDAPENMTKATKKLSNLLVTRALSSGTLYVGGNTIINHNLSVNNNALVLGNKTIEGNIFVKGDTIVTDTNLPANPLITGSITLEGQPQQACIIFDTANSQEKARLCSTTTPSDHGLFVSVDNGVTQNLRINNAGGAVIAQPAAGTTASVTGGGTTSTPALRLTGNPAAIGGNLILQIDPATGIVTQGTIITGTNDIHTLQGNSGAASGVVTNFVGGTNVQTIADTIATVTVHLTDNISVSGNITIGTAFTVTAGPTHIGNAASVNTLQGVSHLVGATFMSNNSNGTVLTLTGNASNPALVVVGNSSTTAPALRLLNNPPSDGGDNLLMIDTSGVIKTSTTQSVIYNGGQRGPLTVGSTNNSSNFITNNATALTINNSQNIGAGTASPIARLNVVRNTPTFVGSVASGIDSVYAQGRYVYATGGGNLTIFDVSNPAAPQFIGSVATDLSGASNLISVQGRYAYLFAQDGFAIVDVANPQSPQVVYPNDFSFSTTYAYAYVQGKYLYGLTGKIADSFIFLLTVYDITNPAAPVQSLNPITSDQFESGGLFVQGKYAYTLEGISPNSILQIYDLSDPMNPVAAGSTPLPGYGYVSLYVQGRYAYTITNPLNGTSLFKIIDVADPNAPVVVGTASASGDFISVQGRYAYIADSTTGTFTTFDVSNPTSPLQVSSISVGSALSLCIEGRYAYMAINGNLVIYDLGGGYVQQLEAGGIEVATLQARNNMTVNNDLDVKSGMTVGRTLQVNGNMGVAGAVTQTSDARKKDVVGDITDVSALLEELHPVKYHWSHDMQQQYAHLDDHEHLGFIAQNVAEIFPDLVTQDSNGTYSLDYLGFVSLLTAGLQENSNVIDQLVTQLEKLEH